MALGLALSTTLGVWIALSLPRSHRVTLALLLIGASVPVLLILGPLPPRRFWTGGSSSFRPP